MDDKNLSLKNYTARIIIAALAVLTVLNFDRVISAAGSFVSVLAPLLTGCAAAYVLNLIMKRLEKLYFPKSEKKAVKSSRRPVCIVLSLLILFLTVTLILWIVVPEIANIFTVLKDSLPVYTQKINEFAEKYKDKLPLLEEKIKEAMESLNNEKGKELLEASTSGVTGILSSTIGIVSTIAGGAVNFVIGLIFAIYILYNKEGLAKGVKTLVKAYMKPSAAKKAEYAASAADKCFSSFIIGQCTEAVILGLLCALGMTLLRLPYSATIGVLVGATALIPIVGAYLGAAVGALMIVVIDPIKALWFLIFLVILQQIEGNVIYPKVVGSSIGLPGMWVLAAVTIGGGLGGILGMMAGVPLTATVYRLVTDDVMRRMPKDNANSAPPAEVPVPPVLTAAENTKPSAGKQTEKPEAADASDKKNQTIPKNPQRKSNRSKKRR